MGLGLSLDTNGHNIVFCGGTGILVFLDLVARLVLQNCQVSLGSGSPSNTPANEISQISACDAPSKGKDVFGQNFKLSLYFTAPSEDQSIGIELCQKLLAVTEKLGHKNFDLKLRLSDAKEKQPRWDQTFIHDQLMPLKGSISKIYVCGAPAMNETFDRAFEKLQKDLSVSWKDIEIL